MSVSNQRRHTKIVATIGPASWELDTLKEILLAGANVLRINAAHNDIATRWRIVRTARQASAETGCRIALLQDLAGPKPRTGPLPTGDTISLRRGQEIALAAGDETLTDDRISIDDQQLVSALQPGQRVLMADGLLEFSVEACEHGEAMARVVRGGRLRGRQGVTVPGAALPPRTISPEESEDIAFAAEADLEYLGVSFVTSARDIELVRQELRRHGGRAGIVAKIERPEALHVVHEIAHAADALMVARGDLGVQLPPEEVPFAQKQIIDVARRHGVPVITATQMMESMITQPIPTRAETSDVANAVLDGSDAVMLSAETATGGFPVDAVEMMDRVVRATERHFPPNRLAASEGPITIASTIARAATDIARRSPLVNLIAVLTRSGFSPREVARERPEVPVEALTNNEFVANQLALVWGVESLVGPFAETTEELFQEWTERLMAAGCVEPGQAALFVGSLTVFNEPGHTNLVHLRQV